MFRGLTATFTREMPGYFCFFFAYEACRGMFAGPGQSKDDIGPLRTVISGGVAGVTLWTVIFPADVVKSRLQVGFIQKKDFIFFTLMFSGYRSHYTNAGNDEANI